MYAVPPRLTHKGKDCPGSEPRSRFGMIARDGADRIATATERVKIEADRAAAEESERWNRGLKTRAKVSHVGKEGVAGHVKDSRTEAPDRAVNVVDSAANGTLVVVIKDSVAPATEVEAIPMPIGSRSLQVTGDVTGQRSKGSGGRRQGQDRDEIEASPIG